MQVIVMELDTKLRDQMHHAIHQQQILLSENYMKPDLPFEVPSSKGTTITYLEDFDHHHHHQVVINPNGSSSSNPFAVQTPCFESFDAFPYNYSSSSNIDFYECKHFADHNINNNSGNGQVMDNFQSGGYLNNHHHHHQAVNPIGIIGSDHHTHMELDFQEMKPVNFLVPDEVSCVSADNGYHKKARLNKNNNRACPSVRKSMKIGKKSNLVKGQWTTEEDRACPSVRKSMKIGKKSNLVKGQWTTEEDRLLIPLVDQFGIRKWSHIAQMLPGRIGKQCRERWHNHLRPDIKKNTWSEEEDRALIEAHAEIGNKWAEIAKRLPGRTENSIKNHWNATKRRQFSKRKCRSKYPRTSLLQDYIKSSNLDAASSSKHQRKNSSNNATAASTAPAANNDSNKSKAATSKSSTPADHDAEQGFCPSDHLVPDFYFNEVPPGFDFDENCSIDSLIEDMPCAPVAVHHDMEVLLDVEYYQVKKDLDLVEMNSQESTQSMRV